MKSVFLMPLVLIYVFLMPLVLRDVFLMPLVLRDVFLMLLASRNIFLISFVLRDVLLMPLVLMDVLLMPLVQEPGMVETLSKNITRQGLTATTLNYLRVSSNIPGRLEDLSHEEEGTGPVPGALPPVSTVVGGGNPGPLPSGPQMDGLDFGSESFQFQ